MKYLLIIGLALVVFWWLRNQRSADVARKPPPETPSTQRLPTEIVACEICQLHLPRAEALAGPRGAMYCGEAHRRQAGG
jgi:uncharacterized protein